MHSGWIIFELWLAGFLGVATEPLRPDTEIRSRGDIVILIALSLFWWLAVWIMIGGRLAGVWKRRRG